MSGIHDPIRRSVRIGVAHRETVGNLVNNKDIQEARKMVEEETQKQNLMSSSKQSSSPTPSSPQEQTLTEQEAKGMKVDERLKTIEELWETEGIYVHDLEVMVNVFISIYLFLFFFSYISFLYEIV